ncbi:heavy-metal-associated domain-containing protein [Derxia gummosa]|uniref:Heavy-metal-associated domain-containing protein n=1 Tax=Derxia gummosa DSM 723 TaxID=1121388 RepID=A0A8B6X564_9BURK|nr:heavy-metal-associated domain-containing protein [Derxia gummosa]
MEHRITVGGMTCQGCARSVTNALHGVDPAAEVVVHLDTGTVEISSDLPRATLAAAIDDAGYEVEAG